MGGRKGTPAAEEGAAAFSAGGLSPSGSLSLSGGEL